MNELEKTLLDALYRVAFERLSKRYATDMMRLEDQISHLQQQVQTFSEQQSELIKRYETAVQLLNGESSG